MEVPRAGDEQCRIKAADLVQDGSLQANPCQGAGKRGVAADVNICRCLEKHQRTGVRPRDAEIRSRKEE